MEPASQIVLICSIVAALGGLGLALYKAARIVQTALNWADRIERTVERVETQTNGALQSQLTEMNQTMKDIAHLSNDTARRVAVIEARINIGEHS